MAGDGREAEFFALWQRSEESNRVIQISPHPKALNLVQSVAHFCACDQYPVHMYSVPMFVGIKIYHLVSTVSWGYLLLWAFQLHFLVTEYIYSVALETDLKSVYLRHRKEKCCKYRLWVNITHPYSLLDFSKWLNLCEFSISTSVK